MILVDSGALRMALNVLRRAGKDEVADALAATARHPDGWEQMKAKAARKYINETEKAEFDASSVRVETLPEHDNCGMGVHKISVGVQITDIRTGIQACVASERSQHRNRDIALTMIHAGLLEMSDEKRTY